MKQEIKFFKSILALSIITISGVSYADDSSLNAQKSNLRNTTSLIEIDNKKIEAENRSLELQKQNKLLKNELSNIESEYIEKINDPIFGENLSKEDELSFNKNDNYGKKEKTVSVRELNKKDKEKRQKEELSSQNGNIDLVALENKIKEIISDEIDQKMENNSVSKNENNTINEPKLTSDLLVTPDTIENKLNPSDPNVDVKLIKFETKKLVSFGNTKKVIISAKFELNKNSSKDFIEDIELSLEENQIYTYYGKVYLVEKISDKTVIINNSTDKTKIIQHL